MAKGVERRRWEEFAVTSTPICRQKKEIFANSVIRNTLKGGQNES